MPDRFLGAKAPKRVKGMQQFNGWTPSSLIIIVTVHTLGKKNDGQNVLCTNTMQKPLSHSICPPQAPSPAQTTWQYPSRMLISWVITASLQPQVPEGCRSEGHLSASAEALSLEFVLVTDSPLLLFAPSFSVRNSTLPHTGPKRLAYVTYFDDWFSACFSGLTSDWAFVS